MHWRHQIPSINHFFWARIGATVEWLTSLKCFAQVRACLMRWSISALLIATVLALALPLNGIILAIIWHMAEAAEQTERTNLLYTSRSIAAAVDAELGKYLALGAALSRSPALLADDLAAFDAEARRTLTEADAWALVADRDGQMLVNTRLPRGQSLPRRSRQGIADQQRAFATGSTLVSDVLIGAATSDWVVDIEIPKLRGGEPFHMLTISLTARHFENLLNIPALPSGWLAGIMDSQGRYIVGYPQAAGRETGRLASEGWRASRRQEGIFEFPSVEGDPIITANARSTLSAWTPGVAIKKVELEATAWRTMRLAMIGAGALSLLSLLLAGTVARRLVASLRDIRDNTAALLAGSEPTVATSLLPEFREFWNGLSGVVSDRKRAAEQLAAVSVELRQTLDITPTGITRCSRDLHYLSANRAYAEFVGLPADEIVGRPLVDVLGPAAFETIRPYVERVLAGETVEYEAEIAINNQPAAINAVYVPDRDSCGVVQGWVASVCNVTARRRAEEHLRFVMREVNHRSKNILALVQSVARQTAARSPEDFVARFVERIQALSAAQDLLVKSEWKGVALDQLVRSQLLHFDDLSNERIALQGPILTISAKAAQTLGMALHELATNAGKYGALSTEGGHVEITWDLGWDKAGNSQFTMSWIETGGPPVKTPAPHGFGSSVISDMVKMSLTCDPQIEFAPAGLQWRISCPADQVLVAEHKNAEPLTGATEEGKTKASGPRRVLVVEDEGLLAIEIASALSEAGFEVVGPAASVARALDLIRQQGCEAAVLDINLGTETSEPIARRLTAAGTPFVTISGYAREQQPDAFRKSLLLSKPLRLDRLVAELQSCLSRPSV